MITTQGLRFGNAVQRISRRIPGPAILRSPACPHEPRSGFQDKTILQEKNKKMVLRDRLGLVF
jgi:hypothetical protein